MAKDLFILRTVFENGDQFNEILGESYSRCTVIPPKEGTTSREGYGIRAECEVENYPNWNPTSPNFIITDDNVLNLGTEVRNKEFGKVSERKVKKYYVICNGNTIETIVPKDWDTTNPEKIWELVITGDFYEDKVKEILAKDLPF